MKRPEISDGHSLNKRGTGLTLYPLRFEEAVKELLRVKPQKNTKGIKTTKAKTS